MMKKILPFFFFLPLHLKAIPTSNAMPTYEPWFTGPLLAPTPTTPELGHPSIEPELVFANTYGQYDSNWKLNSIQNIWSINLFIDFQMAFSERVGIEILPSFISNFQGGNSVTHIQDLYTNLGYQISTDQEGSWIPDFRVMLTEIFPTGKYENFSPDKTLIQGTGEGAFQTGITLAYNKLFHFSNHYFSLRATLTYLFPTSVHVKGFNTYGGGFKTHGTVRPGQFLNIFFSGEYTFNQNWVFGFDSYLTYQSTDHFSGKPGFLAKGQPASVGSPPAIQIGITPSIEYNYSVNFGLLFGSWLTLAGKNTNAFASLFFALVYTF